MNCGPSNHQWPYSSASYGDTTSGGCPSKVSRSTISLFDPLVDKVRCILGGLFACQRRDIRLLILLGHVAPRDPVIFQAEMPAVAVLVQMRLEIFERQVPPDIAVKLPVNRVSRVADLGAPNLLAGFDVARKNSYPVPADDRRVNAETRAGVAVQDRVRIADKIFDPRLF